MSSIPTSPSSEIAEVLAATDARKFFGEDKVRAINRYRICAHACHPDAGGSDEAMSKLNAMWAEYNGKAKSSKPAEVTRGNVYAVFSEKGHWLVVRREPDSKVAIAANAFEFMKLIEGSPVCSVCSQSVRRIKQPDGVHAAYVCAPPDTVEDAIMLPSLGKHLPDGKLDPADLAWIAKRVIFLAAAIGKCDLRFSEEPSECLAVAPKSHMLCVVAPWSLVESNGHSIAEQRAVTNSFATCIDGLIGTDAKSRRILRFLDGIDVDNYTESGAILHEFDGLLIDLFGGFKFHEMKTV